jgi:hypothetical protein
MLFSSGFLFVLNLFHNSIKYLIDIYIFNIETKVFWRNLTKISSV